MMKYFEQDKTPDVYRELRASFVAPVGRRIVRSKMDDNVN